LSVPFSAIFSTSRQACQQELIVTRLNQSSALGYEQITSLSGVVALTVPQGATYAVITPEVAAVRWRDDGTDPTSSVGFPLQPDAVLRTDGPLPALRFIQASAGAVLNVMYYA